MPAPLVDDLRLLSAGRLPRPAAVGAVLVDLALAGHVTLVDGRLREAGPGAGAPVTDPLAAAVLATVTELGPTRPKRLLARLGRRHRGLQTEVDDRLRAAGRLVGPRRLLGVRLGADRPSPAALDATRRRLGALEPDEVVAPGDVALGRLAVATGRLHVAVPDRADRRRVRAALRHPAADDVGGVVEATTAAVDAAVRATTDAVSFAIVAAVAASSAGGGADG